MSAQESPDATLRLTLLGTVTVLFLVALLGRLWFLQILAGERFIELAASNVDRGAYVDAPRGRILAAGGAALVDNRRSATVVVDRQELLNGAGQPRDEASAEVIEDLGQLLGLDPEELLERLATQRYSPFSPVPVLDDVPDDVKAYIDEHREFFPGVRVVTRAVRTYPQGRAAAHLLGYTAEIDTELEQPAFVDYRLGEQVGKAGLEQTYEFDLQGEEGFQRLAVNAAGRVLEVLETDPPRAGNDLVTSINLPLQRTVERVLREGIIASRDTVRKDGRNLESVAGSAVLVDVTDGSVVAMASWPTFDPSAFSDGLTQREFREIFDRAKEDEVPAINRAIQGAYPPGSVFKTVSGAAALDANLITTGTVVDCPSSWQLGTATFNNWNRASEGAMDLSTALMRSCDTFFYELAFQQYLREERQVDQDGEVDELLPRIAEEFGFGVQLGIDLPSESAGVIPSRAWKADYWEQTRVNNCALADDAAPGSYQELLFTELCVDGYRWRGGDAVNASIGQGDILATPLQVASSYAAIANGGTLYRPHIGDRIVDADGELVRRVQPEVLAELPVDEAGLAEIRQGLEDVVMSERGTGRSAFEGFPLSRIPVAGKTGTAELGTQIPYSWFAAYAPADEARYAVAVSVERGGGGSQTSAPIARRILEAAFDLDVTPFPNAAPLGDAILD